MRLCVYEDEAVEGLGPLARTRPACDLWCGAAPLLERQRRHFGAGEVGLVVRPWPAGWCRLLHPGVPANDPAWLGRGGPLLPACARWLPPAGRLACDGLRPRIGPAGGRVAYLVAPSPRPADGSPECVAEAVAAWSSKLPQADAGGRLIDHPWDVVEHNGEALEQDWQGQAAAAGAARRRRPFVIGPRRHLVVDPSAAVEPLAVADTRRGPVPVGPRACVRAFSRLEGPCHVGAGAQVLGAAVRGSTLGPGCRAGGEVEASVLLAHANKARGGFLGHGYLGQWVNPGAGTQTADLRNDYRAVPVGIAGGRADTGLLKVGAFPGDHSRTGVGALPDCGTAAGPFARLLPGGGLLPRSVPPFCTARGGRLEERTDFRRLFAAAAAALGRRGKLWTEAHAEFFLALYEGTAAERREALGAAERGRRGSRPA
jgi:UDP-N-acetylglucosamine diphosphorylase/glucosamine-1-phosphate N-acetyltransferase